MRSIRGLALTALCFGTLGLGMPGIAIAEGGGRPTHRVLVELFTSQG